MRESVKDLFFECFEIGFADGFAVCLILVKVLGLGLFNVSLTKVMLPLILFVIVDVVEFLYKIVKLALTSRHKETVSPRA